MKTSTIVAISVGTAITGLLGESGDPKTPAYRLRSLWQVMLTSSAYAAYFDHKRRTDPNFRKALRREARKQARLAKEEAEIQGKRQQEDIKQAVEEALGEGFPTDLEEREAFFMQQIAQGEALAGDGL
jgi:mitochondrial import receptor subunit TOM20